MVESILIIENLALLMVLAGLLVSIGEAIVPGAQFIVVGGALIFSGLVGLAFPPVATPLVLAGATIIFAAIFFLVYKKADVYADGGVDQTKNSSSLAGEIGIVTETVTRTKGKVKLENGGFNPYYQARSKERKIPEGEEVMVVDPGGGNVVEVERLASNRLDAELERERKRY